MPPKRRRKGKVSDSQKNKKNRKNDESHLYPSTTKKSRKGTKLEKEDHVRDEDIFYTVDIATAHGGHVDKFLNLEYYFNQMVNIGDEDVNFFVAKEVLKDGLGLKGFRQHLKDIPSSEKMWRKVNGKGHKKAWISQNGLNIILNKCRSQRRIPLITYLNGNYNTKLSLSRKLEKKPSAAGKRKRKPEKGNEESPSFDFTSEEEKHEEEESLRELIEWGYKDYEAYMAQLNSRTVPHRKESALDDESMRMLEEVPILLEEVAIIVKRIQDQFKACKTYHNDEALDNPIVGSNGEQRGLLDH